MQPGLFYWTSFLTYAYACFKKLLLLAIYIGNRSCLMNMHEGIDRFTTFLSVTCDNGLSAEKFVFLKSSFSLPGRAKSWTFSPRMHGENAIGMIGINYVM